MKETIASFGDVGLRKGDLIHCSHTPRWWKRYYVIDEVNNAHTITVSWAWWRESWFQYGALAVVWGSAAMVWARAFA